MKLTVAKKMAILAGSALLGIALLTVLNQREMGRVFDSANLEPISVEAISADKALITPPMGGRNGAGNER